MNKVSIGILIILAAGVFCSAQNIKPNQKNEPEEFNNSRGNSKKSKSASPSAAAAPASAMASVAAQLQGSIDVKNATVGDEVVLKTTKAVKQNGETVIPKGANLVGRITEVKQRSKENSMSKIGMIFDRIEGKNLDAPITASIMSITNVQAISSAGDSFGSDITGASQSSGSVSRGGSGGGGGLLGGVGNSVNGVVNSTTQTTGSVLNTATNTVGNVAGTATQTAGSLGRTVNGIQISNSVGGSASGSTTLSSPSKNLKLEKGLIFQMQVDKQTGN